MVKVKELDLSNIIYKVNKKEVNGVLYYNGNFPKAFVAFQNNLAENVEQEQATHIIKNQGSEMNINEAFFMWLAKKATLDSPESFLVKFNNEYFYCVEKFDKEHSLFSFNALLNSPYRNQFSFSFSEIAELAMKYDLDIVKIAKQVYFSWLIHNYDLHTRNISVLATSDKNLKLSPCYDLVCLAPYYNGAETFAISINKKRENIVKKDLFLDFTKYLNSDLVYQLFAQIEQLIIDNFHTLNALEIKKEIKLQIANAVAERLLDDSMEEKTFFQKFFNKKINKQDFVENVLFGDKILQKGAITEEEYNKKKEELL